MPVEYSPSITSARIIPSLLRCPLYRVKIIVRVHPANGRKALFVNEGFTTHIVGLPEEESAALLATLFRHSIEDHFIYRHRWQPHDLVVWDNRSTQHLATGCPPHLRRTLYRTTVRGDVPVGAVVPQQSIPLS